MINTIPRPQWLMLAGIAVAVPLSGWGALYPQNTWLQVGPVALGIPLAAWLLKRWAISNSAALALTAFVLLHLVAARWSYSFVPYQQWLRPLGIDINATFGFHRNMFDRVVHLSFGLLIIAPVAEIAVRHLGMRSTAALLFAVFFVFYEILEWIITLTLAPGDAAAYNGEQGDIWDSQKDMACANLAAVIAVLPARRHLRQLGI
jgi:putative membrane protein